MALDYLRRIALDRYALDHIRIKRALSKKLITAVSATPESFRGCGEFARTVPLVFFEQLLGRMLKHFDEFIADQLSFRFRVAYAFEQIEKALACVHVLQTDVKIFAENALHDFFFTRAQQSVIHENTGKLVADCFVQQRSGHGRINPAAQTEHDLLIANLLPNARTSLFDKRAHSPIHRAVADVIDKIL